MTGLPSNGQPHDPALSTAELEELIRKHSRGRSPAEALGRVAEGNLAGAMVAATVGTLALMALLTVGPWMLTSNVAQTPTVQPAATTPAATPETASTAPAGAVPPSAQQGSTEALDKLGIGQTKESDPSVNPLDNKSDDLLKELTP